MKHKSAILQILHGERGHFELMPNRKTKEYIKQLDKLDRIYGELNNKLSAEYMGTINEMIDAIEFKTLEDLDGHYLEGFKLGLLIGMESVCPDENEA